MQKLRKMKMNKNINPQELVDKLSEDIASIGDGMKNGNFSKEEMTEMRSGLQEVILQAFKTKFSIRLDILSEEEPNLSMKDILVKMLDLLPSDVNPDFLPILTDYVLKKWKVSPQKLAA